MLIELCVQSAMFSAIDKRVIARTWLFGLCCTNLVGAARRSFPADDTMEIDRRQNLQGLGF